MTFVAEDGTGLSNANSYCSIEYADDYFASLGFTEWAGYTLEKKQTELINGTSYLNLKFAPKLRGTLFNLEQSLEFPRSRLYDRYNRAILGVPFDIQKATCEYAKLSNSNSLYPVDKVPTAITEKTIKVGPITTSTKFSDGRAPATTVAHPYADSLVKQYISRSCGGAIRN